MWELIKLKGEIFDMTKIRQNFIEMKEGVLDGKNESYLSAICITNLLVILACYILICFLGMIFFVDNWIFAILTGVIYAMFLFNNKLFSMVMPFSQKLLVKCFGRYGRVLTKKDWAYIKKKNPEFYSELWSKKSYGHCYYYSWAVALFLKDAELMYCSIKIKDGSDTAHAVIVKNNCVYCTNLQRHFDLDEYKEIGNVNVYKMFSEKEYRTGTFFDDIRDDFVKWCTERNVSCNPQ